MTKRKPWRKYEVSFEVWFDPNDWWNMKPTVGSAIERLTRMELKNTLNNLSGRFKSITFRRLK